MYELYQDPDNALQFHIRNPLDFDERADIGMPDLIDSWRKFPDSSLAIWAEAGKRYEEAARAKLMQTEMGQWLAATTGWFTSGLDIFQSHGPLTITFLEATQAMLFKMTWIGV